MYTKHVVMISFLSPGRNTRRNRSAHWYSQVSASFNSNSAFFSPPTVTNRMKFKIVSRIRINILPPRRLSSSSPGTASLSQFYRRTPEPEDSPISYYHSPILHSPIPPFVPSPFVKPVLYASPGKAVSNSPIRSAGTVRSSPSSRQVCQFYWTCEL